MRERGRVGEAVLTPIDEARNLDRSEDRDFELIRERDLCRRDVGVDRQHGLHAVDLHDLAHRSDAALRVALRVLDDELQRMTLHPAVTIDVGNGEIERGEIFRGVARKRSRERVRDADLVRRAGRRLRDAKSRDGGDRGADKGEGGMPFHSVSTQCGPV